MRSFGCVKSTLIGTEYTIRNQMRLFIPEQYKLSSLCPIADQGDKPICVSESLSEMVRYSLHFYRTKINFPDDIFYKLDKTASYEGMQPKTAFEILVRGMVPGLRNRFSLYAKVPSVPLIKDCILNFGPVMLALPARSYDNAFWRGGSLLGGHAVVAVGWTKTGIIIKNSWGITYGNGGYYELPYEESNQIWEAWTLIK